MGSGNGSVAPPTTLNSSRSTPFYGDRQLPGATADSQTRPPGDIRPPAPDLPTAFKVREVEPEPRSDDAAIEDL